MKVITAFFRLIRWPNLVFIAVTQLMFRYAVMPYIFERAAPGQYLIKLAEGPFFILLAGTLLIAAAGYIINDYFDVNIDQINKMSGVIIGKWIRKRSAIILHAVLSSAGLCCSIYAGYAVGNIYIPVFNLAAIMLLWLYSSTFKKKLLVGNVVISLLTAWVILVLVLAEYRFRLEPDDLAWRYLLKISLMYAGFAFIISLIREVVKDMEDIRGDERFGCTTMPVEWGIPASKVFAGVWIIVLVGLILVIQIYIIQLGWWFPALYALLAIQVPLILILRRLYRTVDAAGFHKISTQVKLVMFTGILSMIFFNLPG